ncbi:DUF1097 domain-containing protein [Diplocloster modestus]|nr:DUF1097 domain-containing protein [Diplocloster modestus]
MMKKLTSLDFSVAILAGISCLFMYLSVPVWALFIGWAWYFTLGASADLIAKSIVPILTGAVLAVLAFVLIDAFGAFMPSMAATIAAVIITVFVLMLTLKIPACNPSLVSFNAYSCIFVGYGAGEYMSIDGMPPLINALIWIAGANFIGMLFGYASVKVTQIFKSSKQMGGN